ncbi:uncharacterized protein [Nicotiana tomentosiformis]|uniref:uncharacterized protein n=1 Tax=Nicotiana tomentosiformis TaxID=4098 RepID=UPI00388C361C
MVKAWITNSLTREITISVVCLNNAREVCSDINERFGQSNGSKYIQIQRKISSNSQGSSDIATYFTRMRALWDELNSAYVGPTCSSGALPKFIEDQHLFQFLSGLNESYSTINSSIMLMSPLPSISKAYSLLQHDESQKENQPPALGFSGDSASFSATTTNSTHVNQMNSPHNTRPYNQRINFDPKRNSPYVSCKYCKKPGRTIDKCYRLHGFPADFKFTKNKRFASCVQVEEPADDIGPSIKSSDSTAYGFSKEQYQHLMSLFQQTHISPGIHSSPSDENIGYANFVALFSRHSCFLHGPSLKRPLKIGRASHGLYFLLSDMHEYSPFVSTISFGTAYNVFPSNSVSPFPLIHFHSSVQTFRADNAYELGNSSEAQIFFSENEILHQTTIPHTPQ